MEKVLDINGFANVKENHIIGRPSLYKNSEISFSGTNNAIYFGSDINLINCKFTFNCSNSLIYLKGGCNINNLNAIMHNDCVFYLGKKVYLNPSTVGKYILMLSEHKHIFIGNNCLFSTGISFRTADAHLIYSIETKQRLNSSKSIFVGDSVWIGQNAMLMKGAKIHSGSIIGAGSVISNKEIPSNSSGGVILSGLLRIRFFGRAIVQINIHKLILKTFYAAIIQKTFFLMMKKNIFLLIGWMSCFPKKFQHWKRLKK